MCDFLKVTASDGEGNGESLTRLPVARHDLILADAGYCSVAGSEYVQERGADVPVRINPQAFVAYSQSEKRLALLTQLRLVLSRAGWRVASSFARLRVPGLEAEFCEVRKSEHAIEQTRWRLYRKASKKEMSTRPETLEFVQYVHVFTTHSSGSATEILVLYPKRWQIELVFKRLKSLIHLSHLPKHNDLSSRAWLHGKLLVGLLTQKLIRVGGDISFPLGGTPSVSTTPRHWREFSFLLHQVQRAIEPQLSLKNTLSNWKEIARALDERRRNRSPQIIKRAA